MRESHRQLLLIDMDRGQGLGRRIEIKRDADAARLRQDLRQDLFQEFHQVNFHKLVTEAALLDAGYVQKVLHDHL